MSVLCSVTYLGQRLFLNVPAFLSIHSSVPHSPDSLTIFALHSLAHYHMCKLGLFHLRFVIHQFAPAPFLSIHSSVPTPFLSIHSSVPHLPDGDIIPLQSPVHYHMCKVWLFQVIPARIRTCELSHHSLAHYHLTKLDSDS